MHLNCKATLIIDNDYSCHIKVVERQSGLQIKGNVVRKIKW